MKTSTHSRSTSSIRSAFFVLLTSFLLIAGHSTAAGQADAATSASGYFDWLLGRGGSVALVSLDSVLHSPEGIFRGQDGATRFVDQLSDSFSDLEFQVQSSDEVGGTMVVEFTLTGVHTGNYHGASWDCARVSVPGVAVLESGEDGYSEQWIAYDQELLLDQIHVYSLSPENEHASCDSYLRVNQPFAEPIAPPQGPPTCLPRALCSTPF